MTAELAGATRVTARAVRRIAQLAAARSAGVEPSAPVVAISDRGGALALDVATPVATPPAGESVVTIATAVAAAVRAAVQDDARRRIADLHVRVSGLREERRRPA